MRTPNASPNSGLRKVLAVVTPERQVGRDAQHDGVGLAGGTLVELAHAGGAHRRVDRREDVEHDVLSVQVLVGNR
jgi:hypothetical protein